MLCSPSNTRIYIKVKKHPHIPLEYTVKQLLKEANIDVREIVINSIPNVPIWDSEPVSADFTLSQFD